MAQEYFLYTTEFNNTLVDRSNTSFAPLPPNTQEIFIDFFIPLNQPLYYYRESGGTIVINDEETINNYLNDKFPISPEDEVSFEVFTGFTATTQQQIDELGVSNSFYAFSRTNSAGNQLESLKLTVVRASNGVYNYTFDQPLLNSNYAVFAQPIFTVTDTNAQVSNVSSNGFTITTGLGDNGTTPDIPTDTDHSVAVFGVPISGNTIPVVGLNDFTGYTAATDSRLIALETGSTAINDGVVSGATLNGAELSLQRTEGLSDVTVDLSSLTGTTDISSKLDITVFETYTGDTDTILNNLRSDIDTVSGDTDQLQTNFNSHTGDTTIHYPQSAITITESQISDLGNYVTDNTFTGYTANTNTRLNGIDSDISFISGVTDTKFNITGGTITGDVNFEQKSNFTDYVNPSVVDGDLWYENSALFFRNNSTTFDLLSPPTALTATQVRRTTTFTIPATWGDITFGTTDIESNSSVLSADTVNTDRIIIGDDGLYEIQYDGVVEDGSQFRLRINDSTVINGSFKDVNATVAGFATITPFLDVSNSVLVQLSSGDFISLQAQQGIAGAGTLQIGATLKITKLDSARGTKGEKGDKGVGGTVTVNDNGVNPSPTGGSYNTLNFGAGLVVVDNGDGETVTISATTTTPLPTVNKLQLVDSAGGQTCNDVTPNPIEWGTQEFIDTSVFSHTAGQNTITILQDGLYELSYNINAAGTSNRVVVGVQFQRNGVGIAPTLTADYGRNSSNTDTNNSLSSYLINLLDGDVLTVVAFRLGGNNTHDTKAGQSFVRINYLG